VLEVPKSSSRFAQARHLAESLPALVVLLEECASSLGEMAPWDWTGAYATAQCEEIWLLDYCIVLAELDNFYRSWGTQLDFTPLLSPSGYRSALYASGRSDRSDLWVPSGTGSSNADGEGTARRQVPLRGSSASWSAPGHSSRTSAGHLSRTSRNSRVSHVEQEGPEEHEDLKGYFCCGGISRLNLRCGTATRRGGPHSLLV
jgi:hypothetical protein